ncbi:protein FAR1-RELATED SEQUENCE 5-like [Actinidia eriantha]|uniref:protein FAR1-RELATED SEQUENCE 5-like n=1 Tax=Actinidia eriantha TaxID=165200 RepID=UPI0025872D3E|nr:protein FAR1-RELATED SEQUENCE 5-like [Actinidia eriantha]
MSFTFFIRSWANRVDWQSEKKTIGRVDRTSSETTILAGVLLSLSSSETTNLAGVPLRSLSLSFLDVMNVKENEHLIEDYTPFLQKEFESEEAAYEFYNGYGRVMGFSIRICYSTKSKKDGVLIGQKFVCSKQGTRGKDKRYLVVERPRKETRIKCDANMSISLNRETSKWVVASHDLLSAQVGGKEFLGFTREDQKNYLRGRRQRSLKYGEIGALLGYFQKQASTNPYFYYAVQLDSDEMITNIFWADHEMITDYGLFGDAISFDTTFRTNKECRFFALFTGFNHYRMTTIFGAALLYDETVESFEWLFNTFLHAMSGKKPTTIFTDQDAAMSKAISIVLFDVTHGLCTFHLNQNALKHLGHLFKGVSTFGKELNTCIFGYEDEQELVEAWDALVKKYDLHDNAWMKKT